MGDLYPIDISDLYILEDDYSNGIKIMRVKDSIKTSRVFNRKNSMMNCSLIMNRGIVQCLN